MVAALCIPPALALAQTPATHGLPAGTRIDFVADDNINVDTVRLGSQFRVHLARELTLDGTALAPAGTSARLVVGDKVRHPDGTTTLSIGLTDFRLRQGRLPVIPVTTELSAVTSGMVIPALTQGSIERMGDRIVIRVPVPMPLSSAPPNAAFTALPAATAAPFVPGPRRGATPTPLPTTFNPPDPSVSPDAATT